MNYIVRLVAENVEVIDFILGVLLNPKYELLFTPVYSVMFWLEPKLVVSKPRLSWIGSKLTQVSIVTTSTDIYHSLCLALYTDSFHHNI